MSNKGIKSQQKFLKEKGLYHGALDGEWGNASIDAMKGWAYRDDSGNLDGSSFQRAPAGYRLVGDELRALKAKAAPKVEAAPAPVPAPVAKPAVPPTVRQPTPVVKKKPSKVTKSKKPVKGMAAKSQKTTAAASGKETFTVTGRDGDKPKKVK